MSEYYKLEIIKKQIGGKPGCGAHTYHGQVKKGTEIRHGRGCEIYENGEIVDRYYKEGNEHGPSLLISYDGCYRIAQIQEGKLCSWIDYNPNA